MTITKEKRMGDLIQKLPMDEIRLSTNEMDGIKMLFGTTDSQPPPPPPPPPPIQQAPPVHPTVPATVATAVASPPSTESCRKMSQEVMAILLTSGIFFVFCLPVLDGVLDAFVPLCKNSWIVRTAVKSILFGLIIWIFVNRQYL
jgi:hypothetical protein